jgi:hypothetical protein
MIQNRYLRHSLIFVAVSVTCALISVRCFAQNEVDGYPPGELSFIREATNLESLVCDGGDFQPCEHCSGTDWASEQVEPRFKLTEFNIYPTFSFLKDQVGNYTEFEFASKTQLGPFELENRTVMNVADLPGTIKLGAANPNDGSTSANVRGNGFGDTLSGFFFSRKARKNFYLAVGPVVTAPTASNELLGSDQWTIGPGAHFSKEIGRWSTGFFVWQSWGLTNDPSKKAVNQLFGKPYFIYKMTEKWNLIYIPLGLSHSWKSPAGDDWTIPVGGGVRRLFKIHDQKMGLQFQAFDYVATKKTDPEWELRFTIEFMFD